MDNNHYTVKVALDSGSVTTIYIPVIEIGHDLAKIEPVIQRELELEGGEASYRVRRGSRKVMTGRIDLGDPLPLDQHDADCWCLPCFTRRHEAKAKRNLEGMLAARRA